MRGELGGSKGGTDNDGHEKKVGMVQAREKKIRSRKHQNIVEMKMEGKRPRGRPRLRWKNTKY